MITENIICWAQFRQCDHEATCFYRNRVGHIYPLCDMCKMSFAEELKERQAVGSFHSLSLNVNPVGAFMKSIGHECTFGQPISPNVRSSVRAHYGYGTWNQKLYDRLKMDLAVLLKRTMWFAANRPAIEEALKKTRVVSKVMDS